MIRYRDERNQRLFGYDLLERLFPHENTTQSNGCTVRRYECNSTSIDDCTKRLFGTRNSDVKPDKVKRVLLPRQWDW